jgi:hypothetical protein
LWRSESKAGEQIGVVVAAGARGASQEAQRQKTERKLKAHESRHPSDVNQKEPALQSKRRAENREN